MQRESGYYLAFGALLVTSILWGTTGTAATFASGAGPLAIGAAALGIGGLLQAVIALRPIRQALPQLAQHRGKVIFGALSVLIYPLAFYSSMHLAGVAIGTVISLASAPVLAGILELVILRRPLSHWWYLAAGCGAAGTALLSLSKLAGSEAAGRQTLAGVGLGLIAGLTYATYSWACAELMQCGVERRAAMGSVFGLGGLCLMPVLALTGAPLVASGQNFAVAAYMALVPMFMGYVLFGFGLAKVSASTATTITLAEPAVATILAVVIVGEQLSPLSWVGLVIVGFALVILAFKS